MSNMEQEALQHENLVQEALARAHNLYGPRTLLRWESRDSSYRPVFPQPRHHLDAAGYKAQLAAFGKWKSHASENPVREALTANTSENPVREALTANTSENPVREALTATTQEKDCTNEKATGSADSIK